MNIWEAIIQGIVQGLTEFLPVSSSGHLSLVQHILPSTSSGNNDVGNQALSLFLHFGTLLAVFIVYREVIWKMILEFFGMCKEIFTGKFVWKLDQMNKERRMVIFVVVASAFAIILFLPVLGWLGLELADGEPVKKLSDLSEYFSNDSDIMAEGIFFTFTGILILLATVFDFHIGNPTKQKDGVITMRNACAMGLGQCIAAMPGISRSGTTKKIINIPCFYFSLFLVTIKISNFASKAIKLIIIWRTSIVSKSYLLKRRKPTSGLLKKWEKTQQR